MKRIDFVIVIYAAIALFGVAFFIGQVGRELVLAYLGMVSAIAWIGLVIWIWTSSDPPVKG